MTIIATAHHVTISRLGGQIYINDENTGRRIGTADVIRGFAYYIGTSGSAHAGVSAIVSGGIDGLVSALNNGLMNGRDDRR